MVPLDPAASVRASSPLGRPSRAAGESPVSDQYQGTALSPSRAPTPVESAKPWHRKALDKLAAIGRTTIAVVPTLASLAAAWSACRVEGMLPGGKKLSAVDWLRTRTPSLFARGVNSLAELAGPAAERSVGLSVKDLVSIDEHLYKMLSPQSDAQGVKQVPRFLRQLSEATFSQPGSPDAAYVYLGEGREKDSQAVMDLWNSPQRPAQNPYPPEDDRSWVWTCLENKIAKGAFPVFIDLDGDPVGYSSAEYLAKETVSSLVERGNSLGSGGFSHAGLYYSWLTTRLDSFYRKLEPWMEQSNPALHQRVGAIKQDLTPPWLGGNEGLGPWPSPPGIDRAFDSLRGLASGRVEEFADAAVALDRDLLSGVQSHWIKLMREAGSERREQLFRPLARAWVELNLNGVTPSDAPVLAALQGDPPATVLRPYDRAIALGEVVDHTLNGLGIAERRQLMTCLQQELSAAMPALRRREEGLRQLLGQDYPGLDLDNLSESGPALTRLRELAMVSPLEPGVVEQVNRHRDLTEWMATSQRRYGDVDLGLLEGAACFKKNALAISEYFDPGKTPEMVTILGAGPNRVDLLGQGTGDPKKVSMVLEGGGGKGFCYVQCLKELRSALDASPGRFAVDEFIGTSAGAITAGVMAAGFSVEELSAILTELDFKKFNSDAVWLMGGVDPKVRGINRTGLFSQQKMYQTLYELFSKKLSIEGRPILFRDLPYKLKVMGVALNTDLPPSDPLFKAIDGDGRLVMSAETTPNFDVIGAIIASAAVPGFFSAPQMEVARKDQRYRLQLCDGGVVDNLPVSTATPGTKDALVVLPAHYEAPDPATGEKFSLSVLNFDPGNLGLLDAHNRTNYQRFAPQLAEFLSRQDHDRVVLALNLATADEQSAPALLGRSREATRELNEQADFPHLSEAEARKLTAKDVTLGRRLAGAVFNGLVDGREGAENRLDWGWRSSRVQLVGGEEEDLGDVIRGAGAAALATEHGRRTFESA